MRSIGERGLVAMREPLQRGQRGQVARMSDRENIACYSRISIDFQGMVHINDLTTPGNHIRLL